MKRKESEIIKNLRRNCLKKYCIFSGFFVVYYANFLLTSSFITTTTATTTTI